MERARMRRQSPAEKSVRGPARGCSCGGWGVGRAGVILYLLSTQVRCIKDS